MTTTHTLTMEMGIMENMVREDNQLKGRHPIRKRLFVGPLSVRPRRGKILDLDLDLLLLLLLVTIGLSSNSV